MADESRNLIWVEKYRPQTLADFVCSDSYRKKFEDYVRTKDIPNLLLVGSPGTGKTSLARIFVKNIPCDHMYINASEERGIDVLKTKIKDFAYYIGTEGLKICILDEFEGTTPSFQAGFRGILEFASAHTRFILTCNYPQKIIPPIHSRCQTFEFKTFSKEQIITKLEQILQLEQVKFAKKDLVDIATNTYPDIRKAIQVCNQLVRENQLVIDKDVFQSSTNVKILDFIKKKDWQSVRKLINNEPIIYEEVYKFLFDEIMTINSDSTNLITIADYLYRHSITADPEVNFMALVIQLCQK